MDRTNEQAVLMMLECTDTVTIVRQIQGENTDSYTCEVIAGVSWFGTMGDTTRDRAGEAPEQEYSVRIPASLVPAELPKAGDVFVRGILAEYGNYGSLEGREHFRVATVGDNRRGRLLPHIVVKSQ